MRQCCRSAQADVAAGVAEIAVMSGRLTDANSTAEGAHASAAQAAAKTELLTSACDTLHNDLSRLTAERVRSAAPCSTMQPCNMRSK